MKYKPQKTVFRIDYKPTLSFFENLYKDLNIFTKFTEWTTDRLQITLRNYRLNHSLKIAHNHITYESDNYNKDHEMEIIETILSDILKIVDDGSLNKFGFRRFFLIKQDMSFEELVNIINLKCLSSLFIPLFGNGIVDSTINVDTMLNGNKLKFLIGPMRKSEVPNFIKYNINNHVEPETIKKVEFINQIFKAYPEVALYIDIDYIKIEKSLKKDQIYEFLKKYEQDALPLMEKFIDTLFMERIE